MADHQPLWAHRPLWAPLLMWKWALAAALLLGALSLWPASAQPPAAAHYSLAKALPLRGPAAIALQTARPIAGLAPLPPLHLPRAERASHRPAHTAPAATAGASDAPGPPPSRSPWRRLADGVAAALNGVVWAIRNPIRAVRSTAAALVALCRGAAAFAARRPLAFTVLLVEAVFCLYVAGLLAYRIIGVKLLGLGAVSTELVAGAALSTKPLEVAFSTFLQHVNCGLAQDVLLSGGRVQYVVDVAQAKALAAAAGGASLTSAAALPSGKDAAAAVAAAFAGSEGTQTLFSYRVADAGGAIERMIAQGVDFRAARPQTWAALIPRVLSVAYLVFLVYFFRRMFTDTGGAKMTGQQAQRVKETFDDVAGLTEAKASVVEVVNILRNPGRYRSMGARMPSGLLLVGPPGGGKTLLARCLAGEAGVPFFACSGSDFIEVFAGRGASRVRALFKKAAQVAPCVVFIDELDALGKKRSMRLNTSSEDDQTLNQLLAAMDGFDTSNNGVVVVAATNRYNLLDDALVRPGRFDRVVRVDLPTAPDREAILKVHLRNKNVDESLSAPGAVKRLADLTPNFSGAELAALTNEAAIRAVRRQGSAVNVRDMEQAILTYRASRSPAGGLLSDLLRG